MPNNAPHNALRAAVNRAIAEGAPVVVNQPAKAQGANFSREGYDGTLFADFYTCRDASSGPGWFIFGRDTKKYGVKPDGKGAYVMLCGYVREGAARNYNGKARIGWRTKREAQAWLDQHLKAYPFLKSTEARKLSFEAAKARYVHRFTMEHVPPMARQRPCDHGGTETRYYAPQFRSDREWYNNTRFPGEDGHIGRKSDCFTTGQTWPLGQWLDKPFSKGSR